MMVKTGMFLLLLFLLSGARSQVTLSLQVPPSGVMQKSQLWNMIMVNTSNDQYEVGVTLTLLSAADNNPVLTASGRTVILKKGAQQLKYSDFMPVAYNYLSPLFNADMRPDGFLPIGSYIACYTVSRMFNDGFEPLTEDYISLEVQPLSPPVLNSPADRDTVNTPYPQFTWLPPSPLSLLKDLSYDFVLTRVLPDQSPLQAIQQNVPVYNQPHLRQPFFPLPASATGLDTGCLYAWAIVAKNGGQLVALSDAWTFTRKIAIPALSLKGSSYVHLKSEEDGGVVAATDSLYVIYNNVTADSVVLYTVTSLSGAEENIAKEKEISVHPGENFIRLKITRDWQLKREQVYLLTVINSRREKNFLKFIYKEEKQNTN